MFDRELDDADGWRQSLGSIARSVPNALPGVIKGVKTAAAANPWVAVAGAVAGGVAGRVSRLGVRRGGAVAAPQVGTPAPPPPAAPFASPPAAMPGIEAPAMPLGADTANPAATLLLALLQDPRLAQAGAALAAGAYGPREIPVGGTVAPPAAFLNLVSWLAQEAAQQAPTLGQSPVDGYLKGPDGSYITDVVSPAARARVLLERLQSEGTGQGVPAEPASSSPEQWLIESGMAELV